MAARYWVGGTAAWDGTAGTKWSLTSGGTGGEAVPTSADDVFFDANSGTGTVTVTAVATCLTLDFTGYTGTFAGGSNVVISGNKLFISATTSWTSTSSLFFSSNSGTCTITTNGKTFTQITLGSTGVSTAIFSLQDAVTLGGVFDIISGTFTTNGYAVTAFQLSSSNSNVRTINLGSSLVTLTGGNGTAAFSTTTTTNLTFNAGTSSIVLSSSSFQVSFNAGLGLTFYNVSLTGTGASQSHLIFGINTFNNL